MSRKIILNILFLAGILTSCQKDFLEKSPLDKISSATVWTDESSSSAFVYNTYDKIIRDYYYIKPEKWSDNFFTDKWTDNLMWTYGADQWPRDNYTSQSSTGGTKWNTFEKIRDCNIIISNLKDDNGMREAVREQLLGEGKFLRAMVYFYMAKRFGGVPIIDKPLTADHELKIARNTEEETYNFIIQDLTEATELLPLNAEKGRASKATALALKMSVELQARRYSEVINTFDRFNLNGGDQYSLEPEYGDLFNDFSSSFNSNEIILGYMIKEAQALHTPMQYIVINTTAIQNAPVALAGWNKNQLPQELVDDYYIIDGDGIDRPWQLSNTWLTRTNLADMYKNRDKRFYATVVHDSSLYFGAMIRTNIASKWHWFNAIGYHSLKTGYIIRKYVYEDPENTYWSSIVDYHFPIIRLAEVYLDYAEALLREGRTADAIPYINMVRNRAGLPNMQTAAPSEVLEIYKRERRVELVLEDDRYWSLIRWYEHDDPGKNTIIPELNTNLHGIALYYQNDTVLTNRYFGNTGNIVAIGDGTYSVVQNDFYTFDFDIPQTWNAHERIFSTRRYRFPIPDSQIKLNPNLKQNTGW